MRKADNTKLIGVVNLSVELKMFETSYKRIGGLIPPSQNCVKAAPAHFLLLRRYSSIYIRGLRPLRALDDLKFNRVPPRSVFCPSPTIAE